VKEYNLGRKSSGKIPMVQTPSMSFSLEIQTESVFLLPSVCYGPTKCCISLHFVRAELVWLN